MARSIAQIDATLTKVRTAIDAILDGGALKSYSVGGRAYGIHNLSELRELERDLERDRSEASNGDSPISLANFRGGRGL